MSGWYGRSLGVLCVALGMARAVTAAAQTPAVDAPAPPASASFAPLPSAPPAANAAAPEESYAPPPPAPAAASAAPAVPTACYPSCRSGFVCSAGQCVSRCNPPCGAGERCLASGECALPNGDAQSVHNPILGDPGSWVFDARLGIEAFGSGNLRTTCTAAGAFRCGNHTDDLDDKSLLMFGLDAMVYVARHVRFGVGYQLVPYSAARSDPPSRLVADSTETTFHAGHEHQLSAVVEGVIPIGSHMAVALRTQGGLRMLMLAGDLAKAGDTFLSFCHAQNAKHCEVDQGPLFGGGIGAMVGFIMGQKLRWRADLALERDIIAWPRRQMEFVGGELASDTTYSMTRFWILAGIEI